VTDTPHRPCRTCCINPSPPLLKLTHTHTQTHTRATVPSLYHHCNAIMIPRLHHCYTSHRLCRTYCTHSSPPLLKLTQTKRTHRHAHISSLLRWCSNGVIVVF
jgi:hypothetical protein